MTILSTRVSTGLPNNYYTTNFPGTENPISEGGVWLNGATDGIDWTNMRTIGGVCISTQPGDSPSIYDDSVAILKGTWGPTQDVSGVVKTVNQQSGSNFEEIELRLRSTLSAHSCTGYEALFSARAVAGYCQVVRWNGPFGDFTLIDGRTCVLNDNDTIRATISGTTISLYVNGSLQFSCTDSTYSTGAPGIGGFLQNVTGLNADFGLRSFTATAS